MFDDPSSPAIQPAGVTQVEAHAEAPADAPGDTPAKSAAVQRYHSCRWRKPPEDGDPTDFCSHRDVLPMAGTTGFDPEAWCPDCAFYKVRRIPKKRSPDDYGY